VDESAWFAHRDLVPHALRYDDRVARTEIDPEVAVGELEGDRDRAGEHVEQFVAIGCTSRRENGIHVAGASGVVRTPTLRGDLQLA
jgi:hypothetical protein